MPESYRPTLRQLEAVDSCPTVSGGFALDKNLWAGRRVAVYWTQVRGHAHKRGQYRMTYGTLVLRPDGKADCIGVRGPDGEVKVIHANRVSSIYDTTRRTRP